MPVMRLPQWQGAAASLAVLDFRQKNKKKTKYNTQGDPAALDLWGYA